MLRILWDYRSFITALIKREFQSQYSKSILGSTWVILNPLYMCIIYSSIFSSIMNVGDSKRSYIIYVATGLLAWNFFTDIMNRSQSIYLNYANIIKKQKFPLFCLPIVVLALAFIDFLISFGLFTGYLIAIHKFPGWCYVSILPILLLQAGYAIGLGTVAGILNIFFRDMGRAMVVLLQVGFWITPIVYFMEKLPERMQFLLSFNPLTSIMEAYQTILVRQQWPEWNSLFFPLVVTIGIIALFMMFYRKHVVEIFDEL